MTICTKLFLFYLPSASHTTTPTTLPSPKLQGKKYSGNPPQAHSALAFLLLLLLLYTAERESGNGRNRPGGDEQRISKQGQYPLSPGLRKCPEYSHDHFPQNNCKYFLIASLAFCLFYLLFLSPTAVRIISLNTNLILPFITKLLNSFLPQIAKEKKWPQFSTISYTQAPLQ